VSDDSLVLAAPMSLTAGSFADDVALIRRLRRRPPAVAAVAAGLPQWTALIWPNDTLSCGFTPRSNVSHPAHETWGN
jgi:hypothetical protein